MVCVNVMGAPGTAGVGASFVLTITGSGSTIVVTTSFDTAVTVWPPAAAVSHVNVASLTSSAPATFAGGASSTTTVKVKATRSSPEPLALL